MTNANEQKFYNALNDVFTGEDIKGNGGFVNLLAIKHAYYRKMLAEFENLVNKNEILRNDNAREDFFNHLYSFFSRYFSESGSVYYCKTAYADKKYERVYTDNKDVILFWKTNMLYYVKSDIMYKNIVVSVEDNGQKIRFAFDCSEITGKQNNEKKEVLFEYSGYEIPNFIEEEKEKCYILKVSYSIKGRKTKQEEIAKESGISEEAIKKAINVFNKQSSVDFFINKNAKKFLTEQLDLYIHQVLLDEQNEFDSSALQRFKTFKDFALKLIDFISQFEQELVRIWNKPKFVLNSNYVITIDRLNKEIVDKISDSAGLKQQIEEWQTLGIVDENFDFKTRNLSKYAHLPIDTKYFKELEAEILAQFDNLDDALDGRLIHSENYQALNTLKDRYKSQVQCIYIDPPYNTSGSPIFYVNNYRDSSWLTFIENRMRLSVSLLKNNGINITAIDDIELRNLILLQDSIFGRENYISTITVKCNPQGRVANKVNKTTEYSILHAKDIIKIGILEVDKTGDEKLTTFTRTGINSRREERPRRFFPILEKDGKLYMITDDEYSKIYDSSTKTFDDDFVDSLKERYEQQGFNVIFPLAKDGTKLVWQREFVRVKSEISTYIYENGKIKTPDSDTEIPKTLWDGSKFSNPEYGSEYLKEMLGFSVSERTPKSYHTLMQFLSMFENEGIFADYFCGTGSTIEAIIRSNIEDHGFRKFIGIEMSETFNEVLLPRIKKISFTKKWKGGYPFGQIDGASLFFKYYELEQYENTLSKMQYKDSYGIFYNENPFENYVFLTDSKLADVLEFNGKDVSLDFNRLYENIDFAETISLLKGLPIKKIVGKKVILSDNTEYSYDFATMNNEKKIKFAQMLKPLLWWGE